MKYSQVQEARYAFPGYIDWVIQHLAKGGEQTMSNIPISDRQEVIRQISKEFGQPDLHEFDDEPERSYYLWQNDPEGELSFDIGYWPTLSDGDGELLTSVIK
jgi:hypothetical protein